MQDEVTEKKNQTQVGLLLAEPFGPKDLETASGLSKNGANSQFRRWLYWDWIAKVPGQYGQYTRTPTFGGVKAKGYDGKEAERQRQARLKKKYEQKEQPAPKAAATSQVVPCKLDSCPACGARFYVAKGTV